MPFGFSVLSASLVLATMIFPVITMMASDAMMAVPKSLRDAAYGLGATRWETIRTVVLPSARTGIFTGIVLGLAPCFGRSPCRGYGCRSNEGFPNLPISAGNGHDNGHCF